MIPLNKLSQFFIGLLLLWGTVLNSHAQDNTPKQNTSSQSNESMQIMESFNREEVVLDKAVLIAEKEKHQIIFFMALPLLVLLLTTTGLGIAMGVYGKSVFLWHMVSAGLTVTLALAHAVVGVVWFYPF